MAGVPRPVPVQDAGLLSGDVVRQSAVREREFFGLLEIHGLEDAALLIDANALIFEMEARQVSSRPAALIAIFRRICGDGHPLN